MSVFGGGVGVGDGLIELVVGVCDVLFVLCFGWFVVMGVVFFLIYGFVNWFVVCCVVVLIFVFGWE